MTQTEQAIIVDGIRLDMPAKEYHRIHRCSKHALDTIREYSPMHLQWNRQNPPEPTPAMKFGSALHTAVLEPAKFDHEFCVAGQCEATVKTSGKRCSNQGVVFDGGGWLCGVHGKGVEAQGVGRTTISQAEKDAIDAMVHAIHCNRAAHEILSAEGDNEVSAFFTHPHGSTKCKLRADGIRPTWDAAFDIKTTENASLREFERAIAKWAYDCQAAFYQDGLAEVGIKITNFVFIAVEKTAPYGVATYRLMDEAIQVGRELYLRDLRTYWECERTGIWPGYDSEFQDISVPRYRVSQAIQNI